MGITKMEGYTDATNALASTFGTLASPCRLAILMLLNERGCAKTSEIVEALGTLSQSTVSQHLKELRSANVIHGHAVGTAMVYQLNETEFESIMNCINTFFQGIIGVQ